MGSEPSTVLVTGATSGIGREVARLHAARGDRVLWHGRRSAEETGLEPDAYVCADLAAPDAAERILRRLDELGVDRLDRLVLNAAAGWYGDPSEQPEASILELFRVDLESVASLCHAVAPRLATARGRIVFVSSVVSSLPAARFAVYAATKAACEGMFRALRVELRGEVEVQVLRPGATRTEIHAKSGATVGDYDWSRFPSAESVALRIVRAADGPPTWRTLGAIDRVVRSAGRMLPRPIEWMAGRAERARAEAEAATAPAQGRRALVTGAADGIGRALALRLAKDGWTVLGLDVDAERASSTAADVAARGGTYEPLQADLSREDDVRRVVGELAERAPLDLVVHNAGVSHVGRFVDSSFEDQRRVLRVNLLAPMLLTRGLLSSGRLRAGTTLVLVSSLSYYVGYPGAAGYAASKDGLASYARSLAVWGAPRGLHVLTVFPGPTRTEHARRYSPPGADEARRMSPEDLAEQIHAAVARRARVLVPGLGNRVLATVGTLAPRVAEAAMKRVILDRLP